MFILAFFVFWMLLSWNSSTSYINFCKELRLLRFARNDIRESGLSNPPQMDDTVLLPIQAVSFRTPQRWSRRSTLGKESRKEVAIILINAIQSLSSQTDFICVNQSMKLLLPLSVFFCG